MQSTNNDKFLCNYLLFICTILLIYGLCYLYRLLSCDGSFLEHESSP